MSASDDWKLTDRLHAPAGKGDPFAAAVRATRMAMLITDPRLDDNPIVFANDSFLKMTGYGRDEVMNRNCRFLQGADTDRSAVAKIREAVTNIQDIAIDILNYRKDGTPFWNALYMSPVIDESGDLLFFFASQIDVSDRKAAEAQVRAENVRIEQAVTQRTRQLNKALNEQTELVHEIDHRVKNNLQLILALIVMETRLSARLGHDTEGLKTLQRRVEALAHVHRKLQRHSSGSSFDLVGFIREVTDQRSPEEQIVLQPDDIDTAMVSAAHAAPISLVTSELMHIARRYRDDGEGRDTRLVLGRHDDANFRICLSATSSQGKHALQATESSRDFVELLASQVGAQVTWPADHNNEICLIVRADPRDGQGEA